MIVRPSPVGEAGDRGAKFTALRPVLTNYSGVPVAPIPGRPARLPAQTVPVSGAVSLLDSLPALSSPVRSAQPVPMERVGQSTGLIHYRTTVQGPHAGPLSIHGLADRASVFVDGA